MFLSCLFPPSGIGAEEARVLSDQPWEREAMSDRPPERTGGRLKQQSRHPSPTLVLFSQMSTQQFVHVIPGQVHDFLACYLWNTIEWELRKYKMLNDSMRPSNLFIQKWVSMKSFHVMLFRNFLAKVARYINKSNSHILIEVTLCKNLPPLIALVCLLLGLGMPLTLTQATEADMRRRTCYAIVSRS